MGACHVHIIPACELELTLDRTSACQTSQLRRPAWPSSKGASNSSRPDACILARSWAVCCPPSSLSTALCANDQFRGQTVVTVTGTEDITYVECMPFAGADVRLDVEKMTKGVGLSAVKLKPQGTLESVSLQTTVPVNAANDGCAFGEARRQICQCNSCVSEGISDCIPCIL